MGWSLSRSKKFGPLRVNFSRSGIGASIGVRGARVGSGPRGSYVAGSGPFGLRFRSKAGAPGAGGAMLLSVLASIFAALVSAVFQAPTRSRRRRY